MIRLVSRPPRLRCVELLAVVGDHLRALRVVSGPAILLLGMTMGRAGGALCQQPAMEVSTAGAPSGIAAAQALIDQGAFAGALQMLAPLARVQPEPSGVERIRGTAYYYMGDFQNAEQAFAKALQQAPDDHVAAAMRGVTLFRLGRPREAIPLLEGDGGGIVQANLDNRYVLGLCYLDTHRFDDARHAFAAQYHFAPDSAPAYLLVARMMLRRGLTPIAASAAQQALLLHPHLPRAHLLLGQIALAHQDLPGAMSEFEAERADNPLDGEVYERLGDTELRRGDLPAAQQALDEAVLLEPSSPIPYLLLGHILQAERSYALAEEYLKKSLLLSPNMYRTHFYLSQVYRATGRAAEAEKEMRLTEQLQATAVDDTTTSKETSHP